MKKFTWVYTVFGLFAVATLCALYGSHMASNNLADTVTSSSPTTNDVAVPSNEPTSLRFEGLKIKPTVQ